MSRTNLPFFSNPQLGCRTARAITTGLPTCEDFGVIGSQLAELGEGVTLLDGFRGEVRLVRNLSQNRDEKQREGPQEPGILLETCHGDCWREKKAD
jgi:hypothetical protein